MKTEIKCISHLRLVGGTYIFIGAFKKYVRKDIGLKKILMKKFISINFAY